MTRDRADRARASATDIQTALALLIQRAPAGGLFHEAEIGDGVTPNEMCLRLTPDGPIYTVEVRRGGAL